MSRYIDADALKRQIESPYTEYSVMIQIRKAIKEFIDDAPSVDIEPKRGEWTEINIKDYKALCSRCGTWSPIMGNFCPNCGARMKGADDE